MLDFVDLFFSFNAADALLFYGFLKDNAIFDGRVLCGRSGVDMVIFLFMLAELVHGGG
jgi:hypothetical protein